ncbi:O-succinylbenzoic acid--CoA ligase [Actinomadura sp. NBRC 104412]|uniref:class I adenylate-forming enzyme family protein n=1 Tax=Actinomadura sp. NBRC 104412 TaxID=3032203 RepID=UPI0024A137F2|nr:AMP-binding protein [Actinomadura sp. NBRC 104412]GLZ03266.1 O-succinylbenzoic acid--CoA ligase [Actinomadura sp. NBRC 104412]
MDSPRQARLLAALLPPGPRLSELLAAALEGTGPAICPIAPDLPRPALRALLDALAPDAIETPDGVHPRAGAPGAPVAGGTALLIATSGSTGTPKIVELAGDALRHSARATLARVGAGPGERWLCCLPPSHISGAQILVRSLLAGTEPVIMPRLDPGAVAASGAAHLSVVPTQLRRLLDAGADLSAFRSILLGGAPATPGLLREARRRGARVFTTYGMSETCGGCVYDGVPLEGVRAEVGDDGRIRLAGPVLFTGYRGRPDLTAAALRDGWFLTQDLGAFDERGRLRVRGRADDVINTGGEKVVAGEVAAALARHPGVRDAVVVGRPDPEWGERVTAVVVPDDPSHAPDLPALRAWVRETLPAYAAPRELDVVEAIPLLPSGKPDRERLRRP